jgi:hypothetical protein
MAIERRYANYLQVGHNALEIALEFGQVHQGSSGPLIHSAVITSPAYAKQFLRTLEDSIAAYERQYGVIPET